MVVIRRLVLALVLVLAGVVGAAAQAGLAERRIGVEWHGGVPHVTFGVRDLADASVRRALASGLAKQMVVTIQSYRGRNQVPLATRVLSCRVTYDLWEEAFVVRRGRRTEVARTVDAAIGLCLDVSRIPIGVATDYASVRGDDVYFAIRAEFNPISASSCPRLLRNPAGDDPLVPVVVNIVRREICQAERALEFRSPAGRVP